ncbi:MAG: hypothetical protein JWP57_3679, partial [Spirosoma sp.]|nr:hypothetical protein [Spirosoma sp.]
LVSLQTKTTIMSAVINNNSVFVITGTDLMEFARHCIEEYRAGEVKPPQDTEYLTPPQLAKAIGRSQEKIRAAILAGHYGTIDRSAVRPRMYATVTEARAYHFGGKQAKENKVLARKKGLYT